MPSSENLLDLIEKLHLGTITQAEKKILDDWYHSFDNADIYLNENLTEQELADRIKIRLLSKIRKIENPQVIPHYPKWKIAASVAAIFILLSFGAYYLIPLKAVVNETVKTNLPKTQLNNDITPGGDRAVLILADGSSIILDSANNGTITHQGDIRIEKLKDGLLTYTMNGKRLTENDEAFYNTITTPRGGKYNITLSDGTKVWLNAASSIRFPVVFTGAERSVVIKGEAYFEVAKNKEMPFKVIATSSEIEVLGTHFNVNAYDDEPLIKTTLLEGLVKVSIANSSKTLYPGQQTRINKEGRINVLNNVDLEETMAWKNGHFQFKSSDLQSILRQISRWYDVDIVYHGNVNLHFTGQLNRNENVSEVFEKLALTDEVKFRIEGRTIIVSK